MNSIPMDLFQVLLTVSESKNFREAAEKLSISQPAVTFKLQALESYLPVPVFSLEGRRKVLTRYGQDLCEVVRNQTNLYKLNLEELNRQYDKPENSTLKIGGRIEVLEYLSNKIIFPGKIELMNLSNSLSTKMLSERKIDLAISYSPPDSTEIIAKKLFPSSSDFVISKKLLKKEKLNSSLISDKEFLKNTPSILYRNSGDILSEWVTHVGVTTAEMNVRYIVEDWRAVAYFVNQGIGYSIIPVYVETDPKETVRFKMTSEKMIPFIYYALYHKNLKKIEAFKEVLSQL